MFNKLDKEIKKQVLEYEKKLLSDKKRQDELLNKKMDWSYFEELIQKCNENPNLRIEVSLKDGTKINMATYIQPRAKTQSELIDGDFLEIR